MARWSPGKAFRQALVREIAEETSLRVPEASLEPVIGIRHDYGDKRVFLDVWETRAAEGEAVGCEGQPIEWLAPEQLRDEDFPAANRPIIRALKLPRRYAITGSAGDPSAFPEQLRQRLLETRPQVCLFRAPGLSDEVYERLAGWSLEACRASDSLLIVHGGPEVFRATPDARGLHLPWREAPAGFRPGRYPRAAWLAVSCHNEQEIAPCRTAIRADYITLGPVKPTGSSHPGAPTLGWRPFRSWSQEPRCRFLPLVGLSPDDILAARQAGAQGIAGIGFWWSGKRILVTAAGVLSDMVC